jgi:hypothetical protein
MQGDRTVQIILLVGDLEEMGELAKRLLNDEFQVLAAGPAVRQLSQRIGMSRYFTPLSMIPSELDRLAYWVAQMQLLQGPIDRAVVYMRNGADADIIQTVAEEVDQYRHSPWDLYHVRRAGSDTVGPLVRSSSCRYYPVALEPSADQSSEDDLADRVYSAFVVADSSD